MPSHPERTSGPCLPGLFLILVAWLMPGLCGAEPIRRGLGPEPDSLHVHQAQGLAAINLLRDLREGLVTFDVHGEPTPGQALGWQVLDDGLRYRFELREDARWSNGDPVLAGDFVRAWHRAFLPETTAATAGLLKDVLNAEHILAGKLEVADLGITAVNPRVLEISLRNPAPWILEILAHPVSFPLHADGLEDPLSAPVNGAYRLAEWVPRASIQLVRNETYHAAAEVASREIEYLPIDDPTAELARYRAGELDITESIPPGRYEWLLDNLPEHLRITPYLGTFWLGINLRHPRLGASADLRRALALAVNRDILVEKVLGAGEVPGWGVTPPGLADYLPVRMEEAAWSQQQREDAARDLFRRAGYGEDDDLLLELRYNTSSVHRRMAVAVAAMWKQVLGINTQLVNEEWKVFVNNRRLGTVTEVFRGGWIADYADPSSFLDLFVGDSALNSSFYRSGPYDRLVNAASHRDGKERMQNLRQAEALLLQDMPLIPLYYYVSRHLVRPGLGGYEDNVRDIHLSRYLVREGE